MNEHDYCTQCGGFVDYDTSVQLTSMSPKYKGECIDCGCVHYVNTEDYTETPENDSETLLDILVR